MSFDPDQFMTQTIDAPMETEYSICPEGEFQNVFIADFDSKAFSTIDFKYKKDSAYGKAGDDGTMHKFSIPFVINDDKIAQDMGRVDGKVYIYKELNLDMKSDGSGLDYGKNKNVELGRIRDAAGQNSPGQAWGPSMLRGAGPFVITVVHEKGKRPDGSEWKKAVVGKITRQS